MVFCGSANTAGVFHLRSPDGKYMMNFSQADAACQADGAKLANLKQLGDAQQVNKPTQDKQDGSIHPSHMYTFSILKKRC